MQIIFIHSLFIGCSSDYTDTGLDSPKTDVIIPDEPSGEPAVEEPADDPIEQPIDVDGDGFIEEEDCDDNNENINPDQEEVPYDGMDNDCDESTKDDDLDGDGVESAEDWLFLRLYRYRFKFA